MVGRKTGGGEGRADQQMTETIFLPWRFPPLSLSSFDENQMVWLCVTFKFVCFDGIEGKKLVDEVVREKRERKKENKKKKERERKSALWNVLEFGGSGREKRGKKEKKEEKSKGTCVEEKKKGKKRRKYG